MGYGSQIGMGSARYDQPTDDWLLEKGGGFTKTVTLLSTTVDAGNTGERTTKLRSGLVLGKITATGANQNKYAACDEDSSDGSEAAKGILLHKVDMLDEDGQAGDRLGTMLFGPAYVDPAKCYVSTSGDGATTLDQDSTSLTALRGDGMVFKGDA